MEIPVSRTKISLPTRRSDWVHRSRLLTLFYELLEYKLILVTAPAGYGKTTFTADMAHRIDIPTCWLSLDELDQEPIRFITHFIAAIAARFPDFGAQVLEEIRNQSEVNLDRLTTQLANQVYEQIREHFLIVLDDYYLIEPGAMVREFISLFIQRTDEHCHLALLTRKLPDLPDLTLLVGRTQVGGLSFRELAFTPDEIKRLIHQNYHEEINEETAQSLSQQTEGWVTGLLLSAQSRWNGVTNQMRVARASGIDLSAYLMAQVLNQQPDDLCYFLLQTSLLEEFNAQFCQQVLGDPPKNHSWFDLIGLLLEKNLFIQPLEDGWIRYHHLFRDFLQNQIAQNYPNTYKDILYKLAETYAGAREWEKSRAIYLRLGDQEAVADLIEKASDSLAAYHRYQTLANWIDGLPYELRTSRPGLISVRGITAVMLGDPETGIEWLHKAEKLFQIENQTQRIAQTLTRLGFAYYQTGKYANTIQSAKKGLELMENIPTITRIEAIRVIGLASWRNGDIQTALEYLENALSLYQAKGDKNREAVLLNDLGIIYKAFGQYRQAEEAYQLVLNFWKEQKRFSHAAYTANNLGVLYHNQGKYEQAIQYLEDATCFAEKDGDFRAKALALCSLGDLYNDLDIPEATRKAFSSARALAQKIQDHFMLLYLDLANAKLAHHSGATAYALQLLETAEMIIQQRNTPYEVGLLELTRGEICFDKNPTSSLDSFEKAWNIFNQGKQIHETIIASFYIALCKIKLKQRNGNKHLLDALHLANSHGIPQSLVVIASHQKAFLKSIQGNQEASFALYPLMNGVEEFEKHLPEVRRELRQRELPIPLGPPKIIIQGLGGTRVWANGEELTTSDWQTVRARDIFFFILESPEGVSREKIELTFWPDASASQLRFTFKKSMYRLRRAFEHDPIIFTGDRYCFNFQGDYRYDVEELEQCLKIADNPPGPTEKIKALETLVGIYQGTYLPGVEGLWVVEKREYLLRRYLEANLFLGKHAIQKKNFNNAAIYAQNILSQDKCNEDAYRLGMLAHAGQGNRSEVAHLFELCKHSLMEEFGLSPSEETVELYKNLTSKIH